MAKQLNLDQVVAIIRSGKFDALLGAVEGGQLECKRTYYRLDDDDEKFELAKDVSSFANAKGGAILIGVHTDKDTTLATDIIKKIGAFPQSQANVIQYRDVLKDWIYPNLQKLTIDWFPSAANNSEGIVAIIVGNQDQLWRPFVITRTVKNSGKMSTVFFGFAERSLDRSVPMGIQQLHLLLRDGFRFGTSGPIASPLPPPWEPPPPVPASPSPTSPEPTPGKLQFSPRSSAKGESFIGELLQKRTKEAIKTVQLDTCPTFALAAASSSSTEIKNLFSSRDVDVVRLLENPEQLRPSGFGPGAGDNSRIVEGGEAKRTMIVGYKLLEIWADGCIVFVADGGESFLSWANKGRDQLRVNQLTLIESTYLFVKFVNDVLAKSDPKPENVLYRLWLRRMTIQEPAILFPGPLMSFPHGEQPAQGTDKDINLSSPYGTDPRLIAFKLVSHVYRWFGFDEESIPYTEEAALGARIISPDQIIALNRQPMS